MQTEKIPLEIIERYYRDLPRARELLLAHSALVVQRALAIARGVPHLRPDMAFIEEAAWLHDVGIYLTDAPGLGCHGERPYICHGVLGAEVLKAEGLPLHALVCERHVGVGLSVQDIERNGFDLPRRDMMPQSVNEKIICVADLFSSKGAKGAGGVRERGIEDVFRTVQGYGEGKLELLKTWMQELRISY